MNKAQWTELVRRGIEAGAIVPGEKYTTRGGRHGLASTDHYAFTCDYGWLEQALPADLYASIMQDADFHVGGPYYKTRVDYFAQYTQSSISTAIATLKGETLWDGVAKEAARDLYIRR
jgi:hypothetical protein